MTRVLTLLALGACHRSSSSSEPAPETHPAVDAAAYLEAAMAGTSPTISEPSAPPLTLPPPTPTPKPADLDRPIFEANGDVPADFDFSYRLTECFGSCPTFDLHVGSTGFLSFQSSPDVALPKGRTSTCSKELGVARVKSLVHLLEAKGFFRPSSFMRGPTDASHHIVALHMSGRDHVVDASGGSDTAALLRALGVFFKLDETSTTLPTGC